MNRELATIEIFRPLPPTRESLSDLLGSDPMEVYILNDVWKAYYDIVGPHRAEDPSEGTASLVHVACCSFQDRKASSDLSAAYASPRVTHCVLPCSTHTSLFLDDFQPNAE